MTVLIAGAALLLSLALGTHLVDVGAVVSRRARAQLAADASALAAIAESGPWGRNIADFEARRYAEANGAELVECLCEDGATAVQVTVELDGIVARARAVYDAEAMLLDARAAQVRGLDPRMASAVAELLGAAQGRVHVVSGARSSLDQEILWSDAMTRYGSAELADDWVARPGTSMHEKGLAVDLGGDLDLAVRLVRDLSLPLHRPLSHEPWHFELR